MYNSFCNSNRTRGRSSRPIAKALGPIHPRAIKRFNRICGQSRFFFEILVSLQFGRVADGHLLNISDVSDMFSIRNRAYSLCGTNIAVEDFKISNFQKNWQAGRLAAVKSISVSNMFTIKFSQRAR